MRAGQIVRLIYITCFGTQLENLNGQHTRAAFVTMGCVLQAKPRSRPAPTSQVCQPGAWEWAMRRRMWSPGSPAISARIQRAGLGAATCAARSRLSPSLKSSMSKSRPSDYYLFKKHFAQGHSHICGSRAACTTCKILLRYFLKKPDNLAEAYWKHESTVGFYPGPFCR